MDTIRTSLVEVSVIVDGRDLPIYTKDARFFVAGEAGKPYRIFVRNLHHARIEILESVDGRNVLKDEAADYANGGMVIRAHSEWDNHGWRINDSETRDFVFGSPSESIAVASGGDPSNIGVIGVAVFKEKSYRPTWSNWTYPDPVFRKGLNEQSFRSLYSANNTPTQDSAELDFADLGTGMGAAREDRIGHTTFERESRSPEYTLEIQYRSYAWLKDNGIIGYSYPSAFANDQTGYGKYTK